MEELPRPGADLGDHQDHHPGRDTPEDLLPDRRRRRRAHTGHRAGTGAERGFPHRLLQDRDRHHPQGQAEDRNRGALNQADLANPTGRYQENPSHQDHRKGEADRRSQLGDGSDRNHRKVKARAGFLDLPDTQDWGHQPWAPQLAATGRTDAG